MYQQLESQSTQTCDQIKIQKSFRAHHELDRRSKCVEGEHIEHDMKQGRIIMHEHVGNYVPDPEVRTIEVMNSQNLSHHWATKHKCGDVKNYIDDQQVFYYRWDICKWGKPFIHKVIFNIIFQIFEVILQV